MDEGIKREGQLHRVISGPDSGQAPGVDGATSVGQPVSQPALQLESVCAGYDGRDYLSDIYLQVRPGETVAVLGSNGAGKTTLLNVISGLLVPSKGRMTFGNKRIQTLAPDKIVRLGIGHVPQGRRIFADLTVIENLRIGGYVLSSRKEVSLRVAKLLERWPFLEEAGSRPARVLSGGQQQILSVARALVSQPKLLMLDEPTMGLDPIASRRVLQMINEIRAEQKISILIVEQNIQNALQIADRVYVLRQGSVVFESPANELTGEQVVSAYFKG